MFTTRRKLHQQVTTAEVTGEVPTAALLCGCKHSDSLRNTGDASQEDLGSRDRMFGWAGCLDAPGLLPVGGVRAVYISPDVGGMGWEGNAAITRQRA